MSLTIKDLSEKEAVHILLNRHSIPIEAFLRLGYFKEDNGEVTLYMKCWRTPITRILLDNYKIGGFFLY